MKQFSEKYITANNKTYLIRSFNENDKDNYIKHTKKHLIWKQYIITRIFVDIFSQMFQMKTN